MTPEDLAIITMADGSLAQLRSLIDRGMESRDTARVIYSELRNLTHRLAVKHKFPAETREKKAA